MLNPIITKLATGTLQISPQPGHIPLQRLVGFASRYSSQRQFLLVSKVLGKHYPVTPKLMRWSYRALARKVMAHALTAPSVWIGMAETATGLGYGVYAAASAAHVHQALFIQTTRYHLAGQAYLQFQETHSHATDFFLYYPEAPTLRQQFLSASSLVLIDDEISTGRTFLRLIKAYQAVNPNLQQVFIVSLVNFASAVDKAVLEREAQVAISWIYLRGGQLDFIPDPQVASTSNSINVSSSAACKQHLLGWPGRLGLERPINLSSACLQELLTILPAPRGHLPLLVLGTGECNAPAFLLATLLEQAGWCCKVQATTRSPILKGQAIQAISQFTDNYEDNIPNFIYNVFPEDYLQIIVCHETPLNAEIQHLLTQWQAISARFAMLDSSHSQDSIDATFYFC